jgi:type IV fimbrial biogenesis protein FimT
MRLAVSGNRGFTLVELMVAVAIAAILLTLAVPSFTRLTASNALTTASNDIVLALSLAKMEAVKRNAPTQFCGDTTTKNTSDTLGTACGSTHASGVYVLTGDTTNCSSSGVCQVRDVAAGIQGMVQVSSGGTAAVRFGGLGLGYQVGTTTPYTGTVVDICSTILSTDNHRVVTLTTGSIISTSTATGACP